MVKVCFWPRKCVADPTTAVIYFYIATANGRNKNAQSTGVKVYLSDWDTVRQRTKTGKLENEELDELVYRVRAAAQKLLGEGLPIGPEDVLRAYNEMRRGPLCIGLRDLAERYLAQKEAEYCAQQIGLRTLQMYQTRFATLRQFLYAHGLQDAAADALNHADIQAYIEHLRHMKLSNDYALKNIQFVRQVYAHGLVHGLCKTNPAQTFRLSFTYNTKRDFTYLERSEVEALRLAKLASKALGEARDLFLFQCFTGFSYSDLSAFVPAEHVRQVDGKSMIIKPRQKTDVPAMLPLYPSAGKILAKYGGKLPVPSQQYYNRLLGELANLLGLRNKLTSHVARRTAGMMWLNSGIRLEVVSRMLGHANTLITQKRYASVSPETIWKEAGSFEAA